MTYYFNQTSLEEQAVEEEQQSEEGQSPTVPANKSVSLFQALSVCKITLS